ncbi:ribosome recycling factor [Mucisphaera calidilacus]|uniref:Ribosome-recycling factor n=1 Tax=Mucisphaera calidilacus TaxID=2527982 RepID=A0A518BZ68_9BACT|nr:ribosome recycling factor [Mucisphaera calidilacus]QDU72270.1 Ribosome-recycling factor [Mucisphaera calidilacus]
MDLDSIQLHAEETMVKSLEYVRSELKGVRTGRATTGLVEFVKVEVYGSETDLRSVALISAPEPTQILVKPYDGSTVQEIAKGITAAGLGLNPMVDGKQIRINIPPLSGDRRKELAASVKQMGEAAKVAMRNARRDANKHIDQLAKDKSQHISEDEIEGAKEEIQDLLKKHEKIVEDEVAAKAKEIQEV